MVKTKVTIAGPGKGWPKKGCTVDKKNIVGDQTQAQATGRDVLEEILAQGARQLLQQAIENEVTEHIQAHAQHRDEQGHRMVVRNGRLPHREILTGMGPIKIEQPRVHDRRPEQKFSSRILPPYMRRLKSLDALVPALYLRGVSTGDFTEALSSILGPNAPGLSATNVVRLKEVWQKDFEDWQRRDLSGKRYVYWWADAIYFNVRLTSDRPCVLVIMGSLADGTKELVAVVDGERESKLSWAEVLSDLRRRGLKAGPELAIGDGALGFWAALREVFQQTREQRCWVHKTANVLDKLPKRVQSSAKDHLHEMYLSGTRTEALKAFSEFLRLYAGKYPKACQCLAKDKEVLFTFYDFPAEHWGHLRTTNPIESTFAGVRHRTRQTKGCGNRMATLTMVFQLTRVAENGWRRLNGYELLAKVIAGIKFIDGIEETTKSKAA
jgi:transposase-like protein